MKGIFGKRLLKIIQDQIVQSRRKHVLRDWPEGASCLSRNIPEGFQQDESGLENPVRDLEDRRGIIRHEGMKPAEAGDETGLE